MSYWISARQRRKGIAPAHICQFNLESGKYKILLLIILIFQCFIMGKKNNFYMNVHDKKNASLDGKVN